MNPSDTDSEQTERSGKVRPGSRVSAIVIRLSLWGWPRRLAPVLIFAIGCSLILADEKQGAERRIETTIYVDPNHPNASDGNPGTRNQPVLTLSEALSLAKESLHRNRATRIVIAKGIYREGVTLHNFTQSNETALVLEAETKGQTIITGSEIWSDWSKKDSDLYSHSWNQTWGLAPYPAGWEGQNLAPIVRRREMVFNDGQPLYQTLSMVELRAKPGSFYISEDEHRIYVRLASKPTDRQPNIEVTTRSKLLEVDGLHDLVLRGIVFEHAGSPIEEGAVSLDGCENVNIDHCEFRWNNWIGLVIRSSRNVEASGNRANHNGGAGMTLWRIKDLMFEDNETSYNNWRGSWGGFTGWAVAGIKSLRIHGGTFKRHRSTDNSARGFWLDFDCKNVSVDASFFCRNQSDGAFVEGSEGPISITKSVICNNGDGLVIANSPNVTLRQNVFYHNTGAQLLIGGESGGRSVTDWETQQGYKLNTTRLILSDNAIVAETGQKLLLTRLTAEQSHALIQDLSSDDNVWFSGAGQTPFQLDGKQMNLTGWRDATGQDSRSSAAAPLFVDPAHDKFEFRPGSPLSKGAAMP